MTSQPSTPLPAVPADLDLEALERTALDVATRCARLARDERPADLGVAATKSSATDVVTAMDTASEALARELLATARPGDGFHGEEGDDATSSTGVTWVVDPIDGTVNYLYGHPAWCVSVAAVVGDPTRRGGYRPVAGAIVAPGYREAYHGRLDGGARLLVLDDALAPTAERTLTAEAPQALAETLLATGFGYREQVRAWQGRLVAGLLPQVRDIRRGGSAALDLAFVAAGRVDAYAEHGLNPWDLAAGWLLVTEAGGVVTDLDGGAPDHSWTVAGGGPACLRLRRALADLGAADLPG